jgi:hypothetical protein
MQELCMPICVLQAFYLRYMYACFSSGGYAVQQFNKTSEQGAMTRCQGQHLFSLCFIHHFAILENPQSKAFDLQ